MRLERKEVLEGCWESLRDDEHGELVFVDDVSDRLLEIDRALTIEEIRGKLQKLIKDLE